MLKELFATCLLLHGCANRNINCVYVNSDNSYDSDIVEKLEIPYRSSYYGNQISGLYNFKDQISFTSVPDNTNVSVNIPIDGSSYPQLAYYAPFYYNSDVYYLAFVGFNFNNTGSGSASCTIRFGYYDYIGSSDVIEYSFYDGAYLSAFRSDLRDIYFDVLYDVGVDSIRSTLFNCIFTHDSNDYVIDYHGYYSFYTGGSFSLSQNINIMGTITNGFNGIILSMSVYHTNSGYYWNRIYFDSLNQKFMSYEEAFTPYTNLLVDGKMSLASYNVLNSVGTFSFVHDSTYDDTDFHDLLFTIMDTPIYFITSLFNFELFGMNLFIAFSGLLTLAVVIMIIRKIW